jgi:cytoskeletal protein CcmA (bactofilin family)
MWNRMMGPGEPRKPEGTPPAPPASPDDTRKQRSTPMSSVAIVGKSIVIKGELSGNEDLVVEGNVDGTITLTDNNLVVGADGRVNANLFARSVTITGKVEGDVSSTERVEITATGSLKGNIRSPRVVINDGAFFQGSVEMKKSPSQGEIKSKAPTQPEPAPKAEGASKPESSGKPVVEVV